MTLMIPARPVSSATRSEKAVFKLIKEAPDSDEYACLHSVGLARHRRKAYGEADFIMIGPLGVFCLEAKGGHVSRDKGSWTIGWPDSCYRSHEGPFKQAQGSMYPLMDEVSKRISPEFKAKTLFGWGVVFPDIEFTEEDPEWSSEVICDVTKKHDFMGFLAELQTYTRERERLAGRDHEVRLDPEDCGKLLSCFRKDFNLIPAIGDLIQATRDELVELSEAQFSILDHALNPSNPRVICPGSAGTGKTLIALEAARRLADQQKSVLLVCFNRLLGEFLRGQLDAEFKSVQIWPLHQLMHNVIVSAGLEDRLRERQQENASDFFTRVYPELFEQAVVSALSKNEMQRVDCLIVDEAQDVLFSPTIDAIGELVVGGLADGRWLMFLDPDLQSEVYGRLDPRVLETLRSFRPTTLELTENFRNPEPVVDEVCALTGINRPRCRRQLDSRVEYVSHGDRSEQGAQLQVVLTRLLADGVAPSSITVLSGVRREQACISEYPPRIDPEVVWLEGENIGVLRDDCITAATVSAFKGLENEVIVLTDLPVPTRDWDRSQAYVGMTRAKTQVNAIIAEEFVRARFGSMSQWEGVGDG